MSSNDPVRIATFATSEQAYLARAILADNDIPAFVENELANLYTPALMTGYTLIVAARDLPRARPIISHFLTTLTDDNPD
ncbi:MAG: DUF2007 domain-containing protein [Muribaculaceae bacterium]|nr:DUF2007 domain-containing protein [Muribaculaceae bacterium]